MMYVIPSFLEHQSIARLLPSQPLSVLSPSISQSRSPPGAVLLRGISRGIQPFLAHGSSHRYRLNDCAWATSIASWERASASFNRPLSSHQEGKVRGSINTFIT